MRRNSSRSERTEDDVAEHCFLGDGIAWRSRDDGTSQEKREIIQTNQKVDGARIRRRHRRGIRICQWKVLEVRIH
jgi:hypothetical protein